MDGKLGTFLLGVIAAVVLVMLWRKESGQTFSLPGVPDQTPAPAPASGGCAGCSSGLGCNGTCAGSPSYQGSLADIFGTEGQITPGTPPLNAATGGQGATSFYSNAGVSPDTSFTFTPVTRNTGAFSSGSNVQPPAIKTPGSPTTIATETPLRATQQVPNYREQAQLNQYNVNGVPRKNFSRYIQ